MFREALAQALFALMANKGRAYMTMFGICWGVASTIVLAGIGSGFERGIRQTWNDLGRNLIVFWPGTISRHSRVSTLAGHAVKFTEEDVKALQEQLSLTRLVSAELTSPTSVQIRFESRDTRGQVHGVYPIYGYMRNIRMAEGRFLSRWDIDEKRAVCVLGATVKKRLFGNGLAVGTRVRFGGTEFLVVGVAQEKPFLGPTYSGPDDLKVFIPLSKAVALFDTRYLSDIIVEPFSTEVAAQAEQETISILAARHGFSPHDINALTSWDTAGTAARTIQLFFMIKVLLLLTGAVTLAIGGVGVMNIMLISVTERTREIGVRKAVGARRRHILNQFLLEALILTSLAGLLGMGVGSGICFLGSNLRGQFAAFMPALHFSSVFISLGVLALISIAAGIYPAAKAASLDPIQALRYD